jgi:hypothetical protein
MSPYARLARTLAWLPAIARVRRRVARRVRLPRVARIGGLHGVGATVARRRVGRVFGRIGRGVERAVRFDIRERVTLPTFVSVSLTAIGLEIDATAVEFEVDGTTAIVVPTGRVRVRTRGARPSRSPWNWSTAVVQSRGYQRGHSCDSPDDTNGASGHPRSVRLRPSRCHGGARS